MLRFLSLLLMVSVSALFGFIYGRSDQSEAAALASVGNVCRLADTSLGQTLDQEQVDRAVQNAADLLRLDPDARAVLAHRAAESHRAPRCAEALHKLQPPPAPSNAI